MKAPQIIIIAWYTFALLSCAKDHGKPRTGNWNFWLNLAVLGLHALLMWWGGFFD
jgi:hypothetical protein